MTTYLLSPILAEADGLNAVIGQLLAIGIVFLGIRIMLRGIFPKRRCEHCNGCECGSCRRRR